MRTFKHSPFIGIGIASLSVGLAACSAPDEAASSSEGDVGTVSSALVFEGLADAIATFQTQVTTFSLDAPFRIGFGPHPGLNTENVTSGGFPAKGEAELDFATNTVRATLDDVGSGGSFDLYFVKNVEGSGRTVRPESGDTLLRAGGFTSATPGPGVPPGRRVLTAQLSQTNMRFDIDLVVVTRAGSLPSSSRIAVGARTLLEKRRRQRPHVRDVSSSHQQPDHRSGLHRRLATERRFVRGREQSGSANPNDDF
jgi:hypothetical protein